jgi:hypothetical protein
LRRRFLAAVGYGPKTLQRVLRLRRFLASAGAEPDDAPVSLAALRLTPGTPTRRTWCGRFRGSAPPRAMRGQDFRGAIQTGAYYDGDRMTPTIPGSLSSTTTPTTVGPISPRAQRSFARRLRATASAIVCCSRSRVKP